MVDQVLDVSHYQGDRGSIDWAQVVRDGYTGVYLKATEGVGFVDPRWINFWTEAGAAGLARGAYHFADLGNATAEAAHFVQVIHGRQWELLPVLDIEKPGSSGAWTKAFRGAFRTAFGHPWFRVYSSYSLLTTTMNPTTWVDAQSSIWVARYNAILNWDHPQLELWQHTSAATIPGILGNVDSDAAEHGWNVAKDLARMGVALPKPAPPTPHPVTGKLPSGTLLRQGSTGAAVIALQRALNTQYPAYSHLAVDGDYGPATAATVREFQSRARLSVDGIAGPQTLHALYLV